jgi:hypothetical protein
MLQPDDGITIRLTASEVNAVLVQLGEGPFRIVAPLITKIREQALAHDQATMPNGPAAEDLRVPH